MPHKAPGRHLSSWTLCQGLWKYIVRDLGFIDTVLRLTTVFIKILAYYTDIISHMSGSI